MINHLKCDILLCNLPKFKGLSLLDTACFEKGQSMSRMGRKEVLLGLLEHSADGRTSNLRQAFLLAQS